MTLRALFSRPADFDPYIYMLKILYNPEMAKNGCYWPKMMEDDPSGWKKLLPDHPYSIPNDFTIEYKQVYAENLLKLC